MKKYFILSKLFLYVLLINAQPSFPEQCIGDWSGKMTIYGQGTVKDTIPVSMTIGALKDTIGWSWKTLYHTSEGEIVKDYKLYPKENTNNEFILDENNGIILYAYVQANKMYSSFEVQGSYLNSVYEIKNDTLIFEIVFGKETGKTGNEITNYSIDGLQRSVLSRKK